ncbi:asparagine synthase (glutamine-hydrolyzing) [Fructilactobacillus fructivorans]|uniref:asparagine synthase (glutamine-hydrolyzing) n=1 Tax=Fructilactobacillus fructivorans TaxID=1614 RepID=A0AAE6P0Y7_9LACO|nr:asparagine synthase (glutamine-hydrolyzing) [Fructilactobacillus fructivorans]KRK57756.1 asparagine synthase [Fructilactobacillus fructivorans]KRN12703.1 asparagine synthase [Fructilactobacillus fructivorans]KRN43174.1 asparagine synthase [Fructilactobacillus fructivorans]QFX92966.1 asparagine synthase (glutamine-hydrolyzing) [Fructilactobacillus fructivorans]RDV65432.1 asparagine synthase (glutamine-hydrolyzing) [Fructilactobacillus fructivorans]
MCGFTGYINQDNIPKDTIKNMAQRIKHRGPDDDGFFQNEDVSMGFRRLSIIDLANGHQPMFGDNDTDVLTFNGEIYNYKDLQKELIEAGQEFDTDCDSEVLIRGYEAWGPKKLLSKLRGMFAFAIYDSKKHQVFGARDHFGIKPMYYYDDGKNFMWGSEIKAFLANPNFKKEINTKLLPVHLSFEFIPSAETMFKNVYKVMPGQYFIYKDGKTTTDTFYKYNYDHIDDSQTIDSDAKKIEGLVDDSVKVHMASDVPLGSFLSSGVDSSYVLNEAAKIKPMQSFSLGFNGSKYSELSWSTKFAKEIGQKNTATTIDGDDYFDFLPTMMYYMDEPLSNPSAPQLYYLSHSARKDLIVSLSGEGADEFFGGYNTYLEAFTFEKYQKMVPKFVRTALGKMASMFPRFHGRRFLMRGAEPLYERYYRVNYVFDQHDRDRVLKDKSLNFDTGEYTKHIFDEVAGKDEVTQEQYFDINTWLPFDILHKADRMSMANSLEVRTPLVDKEVAAFAQTMPTKTRITFDKDGNPITKAAFRKAAASQVPKVVADKEKLGFPSPIAQWIKEPKYHDRIEKAFHSDIAKKFFNVDELDYILKEHMEGKSSMQKIFTIYTFILWYGVYFPEDTNMNYNKEVDLHKYSRESIA